MRGRGIARHSLFDRLLAGVAQLAEQLICNQQVAGSSPIASSRSGAQSFGKGKGDRSIEVQSENGSRHSEEIQKKQEEIQKKQIGLAERK